MNNSGLISIQAVTWEYLSVGKYYVLAEIAC